MNPGPSNGNAVPAEGVIPPSTSGGRSGFLSGVLIELGFADRESVEHAVRAARSPGTTVARALVDMNAITEEQLARAIAERHGVAYVDLESYPVDPAAANLINPEAARRYRAVPIGFADGALLVAMVDPADALGVNDIAHMSKRDVQPAAAPRPGLEALLERLPLGEEPAADEAPRSEAVPDAGDDRPAPDQPPADDSPSSEAASDGDDGPAREEPPADEAEELLKRLAAAEDAARKTERLGEKLAKARRRLDEAEARSAELGDRLAATQGELDQARAAASEADALRDELERARAEAEELRGELEDADRRAEQARQALSERREEGERERERAALVERELRAELSAEQGRRLHVEERLSEIEGAASAAERAFEELRLVISSATPAGS